MALLQILVLLTILRSSVPAAADVITLNGLTFTDKVKEKDTVWFINFCVPSCKHCMSFNPLWEELGKAMETEDGAEVAHLDCTTSKTTCRLAKINSYPTLKLFYNGEEMGRYSGPRDLEALKNFVVEATTKLSKGDRDEALL